MGMLEMIRSTLRMASVAAEIPRKQAERLARELSSRGEVRASQVSAVAEEIVKRSRQNAEMVRTLISSEIRRQLRLLGLASKDDVDALTRRVRQLESSGTARPAATKRKPKPKPR